MKPSATIITTTKKTVDELLSLNSDNRPIRKRTIETYIREIRAGKWCLTNQGVGISDTGVLIDGQHRLLAIKECGYPPLEIVVVSGLSMDARLCVDQHAKRSARDLLQFCFGYRMHRSAPAVAGILFKHREKRWTGSISIHELVDVIDEFRDEMEAVISAPKNENTFQAGFLAGFVFDLKHFPTFTNEILSFIISVESGEMLTRKDPAFHLRSLMLGMRNGIRGGDAQRESFFKTVKALDAFINGDEMGVLKLPKVDFKISASVIQP